MAAKTVKITCKGVAYASIDEYVWFQGDLKVLPEANYEKLKRLILRLGFCVPLGVWFRDNELVLVDGHQRILTLKRMRDEGYVVPMVPYFPVEAADINDAKEKVLSMASQFGVVTDTGLLSFVAESDIKISKLDDHYVMPGLDLKAIAQIDYAPTSTSIQEDDDDDVERLIVQTEDTVKLGEIWTLGVHRLMCGDSTSSDAVQKLLGGERADMVFTDPPYGINEKGDRSRRGGITQGNNLKDFVDDSVQYAIDAFKICRKLEIPIQVWFGANYYCHSLPLTNNWLVWDKRIEEKQVDFNSDAELAWVQDGKSSIRIFRHLWKGLIKGSEHGQRRVHPTQKPVALAEWCIEKYKVVGVLDLFGGSGSTLIACEKTKRKCFMMELDPHYCSVIVARWEKFTGKTAKLEKVSG